MTMTNKIDEILNKKTKFIFITGGVVSSLGKGLASASLASVLQSRGFKVRLRKLDPYLNVDPGTMSPYQHGEVFVTEDGAETDLDLGHYERFVGVSCRKTDSISGGRIYYNVLTKERKGEYLGATVQMIPHVTDELKLFIKSDLKEEDFVLYEVGGTVGDIEGTLLLEAIRQFSNEVGRENCCFVYLTLLPYIETAGELKTKPTQQAVKKLLESGIQADILLCRSKMDIPAEERRKLGLFCNVSKEDVVAALDVDNIYKIPLSYHEQGLDTQVLKHFGLYETAPEPDLTKWHEILNVMGNFEHHVNVAVVGKYCGLPDAYKSLREALVHAGISNKTKVNMDWIDSESLEGMTNQNVANQLKPYHAVLVPGGFGIRGIEGKIKAITYARENNVKFSTLNWITQPLDLASSKRLTDPPQEGIYIDGLVIEGAKWDFAKEVLAECGVSDTRNELPVIHMKPHEGPLQYKPEVTYECPVFRTKRRGSPLMDKPNYTFSLFLPSKVKPIKWIEGSVSAFTTSE